MYASGDWPLQGDNTVAQPVTIRTGEIPADWLESVQQGPVMLTGDGWYAQIINTESGPASATAGSGKTRYATIVGLLDDATRLVLAALGDPAEE